MADDDALVEALAALAHAQWSGWMRHQFERAIPRADGSVLMGAKDALRWKRQMQTPYADLPEKERESDRKEARRVLALLAAHEDVDVGEEVPAMVRGQFVPTRQQRERVYIILAGVLDSLDQAAHLTDRIMALMADTEET